MKRLIMVIFISSFMMSNFALAAFTECTLDYKIKSYAVLAEFGRGKAKVHCKDVTGQEYSTNLRARMVGLGVKAGVCKAKGHVKAVGVGFSLEEFLSVMGKGEVGMILGKKGGGTVDVGASINPTLDMRIVAGGTEYSGNCIGIGSIQGLVFNKRHTNDN